MQSPEQGALSTPDLLAKSSVSWVPLPSGVCPVLDDAQTSVVGLALLLLIAHVLYVEEGNIT